MVKIMAKVFKVKEIPQLPSPFTFLFFDRKWTENCTNK